MEYKEAFEAHGMQMNILHNLVRSSFEKRHVPVECKCEVDVCKHCGGEDGEHLLIEVMGDGPNFEWDVIGTKPCPAFNDEY